MTRAALPRPVFQGKTAHSPRHFRPRFVLGLLLATGFFAQPAAAQTAPTAPPAPAAALLAQPGYYRLRVGAVVVTALSDGTLPLPLRVLLTHTTPAETDKTLARAGLSSPTETSVNAYLIELGSRLVLVDAGCGQTAGSTAGHLRASLRAAGYQPEQVTDVLLTHLHSDHFGGLLTGGQRTFPNATVHLSQTEADYDADLAQAPAGAKPFVQAARATLAPYAAGGKIKPFAGSATLFPGLRAMTAPGHTPGHSFYVLESQGQQLAFWGDLLHAVAVQLPQPSIGFLNDTSPPQTTASRQQAFPDAARQGYRVALAHGPFPGIGYVRAAGAGYEWVPVNYSLGASGK